jgi:UDP-N-acetylmuramoyl-L-alanyl-D-glutamate--2,6-diaminopimelate ligase
MTKPLKSLISSLDNPKIYGQKNRQISGISDDSKKVKRNFLFVAIKGETHDGHDYISEAIKKGAKVVVGEKQRGKLSLIGATYIEVNDSREALGRLAACWYDYPSEKLSVIGVTGTDGKTTTATLIHHILEFSGEKAGLISTVSAKVEGKEYETGLHVTSPEPLLLQELLFEMVKKGCKYAVLEVTSHGIAQKRIQGVSFDISVLTNITHEHLDYHKSFEEYRRIKVSLLKKSKKALVNKKDPNYEFISRKLDEDKLLTYSFGADSDYEASDLRVSKNSIEFQLQKRREKQAVMANFGGEYNALNVLAAISACSLLGVSFQKTKEAVSTFKLPKGRLEKIKLGQAFDVFVDFAHTPNSLENVLKTLSKKKKGRLIAVFGSAGERDPEKRRMMGKISARLADISIFTAEDPRSEDIHKILREMTGGAKKEGAKEVGPEDIKTTKEEAFARVPERGEAIFLSVRKVAEKGDVVLIAGKGHEKSMAYDHLEHPWSDHLVVKDAIKAKEEPAVIVMAAGLGTRMNSSFPKVLQKIAGRPMISYTLQDLRRARLSKIVVVVGYKKDKVVNEVKGAVDFAVQEKRLGTAHAAGKGLKKLKGKGKRVVVLNGDDSAFYRPETIKKIIKMHDETEAVITFVSLVKDNPTGLGRVLRDKEGNIAGIVEEKDADSAQKKIKEVNDGLYVFDKKWLADNLKKVKKNKASGEYYLVDLVRIALDSGGKVEVFKLTDPSQWQGVNTKEQLKKADKKMRKVLEEKLQE